MTPSEARASLIDNAKKTKEEVIKPLYKDLLKNGWTLPDIDAMDIHFYLDLYKKPKAYIDQIW